MRKKLEDVAVVMNGGIDQVAIAKEDISSGIVLECKSGKVKINNLIKKGHRFALIDIKESEFVRQYGYPFAQASKDILKGEVIAN